MAELFQQIEDPLDEADDLGHGVAQLALTERAVELADILGDDRVTFFARSKLVGAGTFAGRTDIAMVAYSWLLAKYDESPEDYAEQELLWQYKWILENVADFPNIQKVADRRALRRHEAEVQIGRIVAARLLGHLAQQRVHHGRRGRGEAGEREAASDSARPPQ